MRASSSQDSVKERTLHVLSEIFAGSSVDNVAVRLWDGTAWPDETTYRIWRLTLPGPGVDFAAVTSSFIKLWSQS